VVPTYLWSACTQNHSCMGSIPDSSAVREESGTETKLQPHKVNLYTKEGVESLWIILYRIAGKFGEVFNLAIIEK